jgi:poly(hydroxyalkanoate) depolymerase family esterase
MSATAGSWQQSVSIGGFNSVNIYTPDSSSPIGNGKALLLVLHGCVQPISNYLTANLEDAAEAHGMVVAVPDAMNKAGFSCWSYWQGAINRSSGDYKNLIQLADSLSNDASRGIDADQVYISGLSSGAAFAAQTACVAPDVFAGVAPSAGPTIGTSSNGALNTCEVVSATTFKNRCLSYAGSNYQSFFDTQLAVVAHGDADTTVDTCYNQQNAIGFANVYGVSQLSGSTTISEGPSNNAQAYSWQDNRVSMLWLNNLDHSWSGGTGASGSYVGSASINFASHLGAYFAEHNLRVDRNAGPTISNFSASETNSVVAIAGSVVDAEGSVESVLVSISDIGSGQPIFIESPLAAVDNATNTFNAQSGALADGLYSVSATGTDNEAAQGDTETLTIRVGPEPAATAPILSDVTVSVDGQCATVSGTVVDINLNLDTVVVNFSGGAVAATMNGTRFDATGCDLPGGSASATIVATDTTNLSATESVSFVIDAGVTGDYNLHINEGHITWGVGYSACYLEFGTADFTMREESLASQCKWTADGAPACSGPVQSCSSGGGGSNTDADGDGVDDSVDNCVNVSNPNQEDNDSDGIGNVCDSTPNGNTSCTDVRSSNYSHVSAGRATNSGYLTYATGSGDYLGFYSIYSYTTVKETSAGYHELGNCP